MEQKWVYIDGEFYKKDEAKVSVFDHGYLYGDGVFEGIRAYNGRVFRCEEHIDRLYDAAKAIALEIPMTKEELIEAMLATIRKNQLRDCYIRLVVSRGKGDLGVNPNKCKRPTIVIITDKIEMYPPEMYKKGMKAITASTRRNMPGVLDPQIKSLNYLNNILAKIEANHAGASEAIMLNQNGLVTECTGDNIFIVKDGVLMTPPIYVGALDGITRRTVISLAEKLDIPFKEKELTLFNVYGADECFFTGTAAELIAVTEIDNRIIGDGQCGPITARLLEEYQKVARSEGREIY
ncbi:MAG TPA: branched-chain-amino-acid transaminase [Clostridiales bacterium]|nr:branched-chain-amino-acid transaminase [Clostridiales bacterium]